MPTQSIPQSLAKLWQRVCQRYRLNANPSLVWGLGLYGLMIVLGSIKPLERGLIGMFNDKLLHLLAYMVISTLVFRGLKFEFYIERLLATLGIVASLAAFDELLQLISDHRRAQFDDWLYDVLGAVFVLTAAIGYRTAVSTYRQMRGLESEEDSFE